MELISMLMDLKHYQELTSKVRLRPGAQAGIWCSWILPLALILSLIKYSTFITVGFRMATLCSILSSIYLNLNLLNYNPSTSHVLASSAAILYCIVDDVSSIGVVRVISISILISMKSYSFFFTLLKTFPESFSIGEAALIIEGAISFITCSMTNYLLNKTNDSFIFSQVFLLGVVISVLIASFSKDFQPHLLPFIVILFGVMGIFTLPILYFVLKKNPLTWIFLNFIPSTGIKRILLIIYWALCTLVALLMVWFFGIKKRMSIKLTILRKFFHVVAVAIYLPGVLLDPELLFMASVFALAAFFLLEAIRLNNFEGFGAILNSSMSGFLDEKDQGSLILTHIYLLVGCSFPVWILPVTRAVNIQEILLMCSGVFSLGVGDTAASVGGSIFGRTKWNGNNRSVEGTACFITALIIVIFILQFFGILVASHFPWLSYLTASLITSLVEAHTTQVDNLILPLVMYIVLLI